MSKVSEKGAVTTEGVLVLAFLAITAFVSVPPLLRLFNTADLASRAAYAVVGQYGRQSGIVTINDAGIPELADDFVEKLKALNSDVLYAVGATSEIVVISAIEQFQENCSSLGEFTSSQLAPSKCLKLQPDIGWGTCDVREKILLETVAADCGQCRRAMPYVLGVAVFKAPLTQESVPLAAGCPPVRPMPLQQGRSGPVIIGSDGGSSASSSSSGQSSSANSSSSSSDSSSSDDWGNSERSSSSDRPSD